jgi:hypothetical protein
MEVSVRSRCGAHLWVVLLVAGISLACGDDPTSPASPTRAAACTTGEIRVAGPGIEFGGGAQPVGVSGGSFSARVTVSGNCQWTVSSDAAWVTTEAAGTGVGSGLLTYRVASNAAVARQARLTLFAGQPSGVLFITQDGPAAAAGCAYELRPTVRSFAATSSSAEVRVFAPYGCRWAFEGNGSWITVGPEDSGPSPWGDGNGTVVVVVAVNPSAGPRTGSATIGGQTFGVTQDGQAAAACTYAISPAVQSAGALGGPGSASINTAAGCSWRADIEQGGQPWITFPSGLQGAGSATIPYTIQPNPSLFGRTASIVVRGDSGNARLVQTVTQPGATCVYTVSPSSSNWGAGGGRTGIAVSAEPGSCSWRASTDAAWIAIDAGASGTGSGLVEFRVSSNATGASRSGDVLISGLSGLNPPARHRVTQAAQ